MKGVFRVKSLTEKQTKKHSVDDYRRLLEASTDVECTLWKTMRGWRSSIPGRAVTRSILCFNLPMDSRMDGAIVAAKQFLEDIDRHWQFIEDDIKQADDDYVVLPNFRTSVEVLRDIVEEFSS